MKPVSAFILAVAPLLLAACTAQPPSGDASASASASSGISSRSFPARTSSSVASPESDTGSGVASSQAAASSVAAVSPPAQTPRIVTVQVTTWAFSPSTITAKKGEKVQLVLVGGEGIHSFAVADLGLNVRVEPGRTVTVDLPTDKAGTFGASCRVPCGSGHKDMQATVIITE